MWQKGNHIWAFKWRYHFRCLITLRVKGQGHKSSSAYNCETVHFRHKVCISYRQEILCELSNGAFTFEIGWPWMGQTQGHKSKTPYNSEILGKWPLLGTDRKACFLSFDNNDPWPCMTFLHCIHKPINWTKFLDRQCLQMEPPSGELCNPSCSCYVFS